MASAWPEWSWPFPTSFQRSTQVLPHLDAARCSESRLDLQGGAHFLVEVRVEDVYRERMESFVSEARTALREGGVRRFTGLRAGVDSASVRITRAEDVDAAGEILRDLANPIAETLFNAAGVDVEVEPAPDQSYEMILTPVAKAQIARRTLEQSLEVIRRRVDELGTREPTIQAQGERRILVQLPGASSVNPDIIGKTAKLTFHLVDESATRAELDAGRAGPGRIVLPDAETPECDTRWSGGRSSPGSSSKMPNRGSTGGPERRW